ncbi:MAG TPA: hypothetical protein VNA12_01670 [Mycobacteriales bacterium]|nr:hypothetical protein [Mycobacteriales bacterium]
MARTRRSRLVVLLGGLLAVATASSALGHAEITPGQVEPGQRVTLTVESIVERPTGLMNVEIRVIVPRQWKTHGCAGPVTWTCKLDTKSYKPHTHVVFTPVITANPADIRFTLDVEAPKRALGSYLFRTLQKHNDGYTEPWVYDREPYPAPRVRVGASTDAVNPEGSREDPKCFGPAKQPSGYDSHDGSSTDKGCPGAAPRPILPGYGVRTPLVRISISR